MVRSCKRILFEQKKTSVGYFINKNTMHYMYIYEKDK